MNKAHSKTCLIVDDSRVVRKVARRIAEDMGFTCSEAEDGQKAYGSCRSAMPDAVILDWSMPVMNGLEFLEKLRRLDGGKHPKVILCTIESSPKSMRRALDAGADEYIVKPFDNAIIESKFMIVGLLEEQQEE